MSPSMSKQQIPLNQWIDGALPEFGCNERVWVLAEYLAPFTRVPVYIAVAWTGKSYSERTALLAQRWMLITEPKEVKYDKRAADCS